MSPRLRNAFISCIVGESWHNRQATKKGSAPERRKRNASVNSMTVKTARDLLMDDSPEGPVGQREAELAREKMAEIEESDFGSLSEGSDANAFHSYADNSVGLGVDIVEIERMARIIERSPAFTSHVFSEAECEYCDSMANPATHYALRFAAKEAVVKALGTGFADGIGVRDIEVQRARSGKPIAKLSGRALEIATMQGVRDLTISLSYTHTDAVACAMAVTEAAARASEKRKDPMEELARQFKETRSILDEL